MKSQMAITSGVSMNAHCTRSILPLLLKSMSPRPMSWLAPGRSMMVRESTIWNTRNATRPGKLALMTPVMTLVEGRWVARIMCMPTARAFWAMRAMGVSTSFPAVMMRSANSSTITTI